MPTRRCVARSAALISTWSVARSAASVGTCSTWPRSGYVNLAVGRIAKAGGERSTSCSAGAPSASGAFDFIADAIVAHTRRQRWRATPLISMRAAAPATISTASRVALPPRPGGPARALASTSRETPCAWQRASAKRWPSPSPMLVGLARRQRHRRSSNQRLRAEELRGNGAHAETDGRLAVAYAGPDHLIELREMLGLMDPQPGKGASYRREMHGLGAGILHDRLRRSVQMSHDQALDLILMGPNARHVSAAGIPAWSGAKAVTFEVELLVTTVI